MLARVSFSCLNVRDAVEKVEKVECSAWAGSKTGQRVAPVIVSTVSQHAASSTSAACTAVVVVACAVVEFG